MTTIKKSRKRIGFYDGKETATVLIGLDAYGELHIDKIGGTERLARI